MDIKEDIEKQLNAGFSKEDIYKNLEGKGYTAGEIDQHYVTVSNDPEIRSRNGSVSTGSILLGILFLVVMVVRFARYQNNGNSFMLVGVITAFILALLFFTRKK